jgi:hypothetical protein
MSQIGWSNRAAAAGTAVAAATAQHAQNSRDFMVQVCVEQEDRAPKRKVEQLVTAADICFALKRQGRTLYR